MSTLSTTRLAFGLTSCLLIALCSAPPIVAQSFQAQLTGVITDQSGAVVPEAQLTVTNVANGSRYSAKSSDAGTYTVPALPPAEYRVTCKLSGFKTVEQKSITLQVNQVYKLDVTLEPGNASEQITVNAAPPALETSSATLGQIVTTRSIEGLPLNVRDPLALVGLTPGVTFGANFGSGGGQEVGRNFFKSDFNVGGGRSGSQELLLDGAPNTTPDINRGIINPPVDSVQEFKVQANSYDAEFGRTSGGVVNVITKSGTNEYHGLAYDFERHSVLDANNFFNNRAGRDRVSFSRHQFGGNLGGPILKNKWFAFGDYEGFRQGFPITTITTVPTPLQRQGDFSQTFTNTGALVRVYDPQSLVTLPNGTRQRTAFANNRIAPSRFDPVAVRTLTFMPLPNVAGDPLTGQNNYIYTAKSITDTDKYDLRTDLNFTESTRMFVRFSRQTDVRASPGNLPLPIGGGRSTRDNYSQALVDLTKVISPNVVADLQFSFSRALANQTGASQGFDVAALGLPSSYVSQVVQQFPVFNIGDVVGTSNGQDSFLQFQPRNIFVGRGNVSYLRNQHNFKFGGEWRSMGFNEAQNTSASGTYGFGRQFTQGPNPVVSTQTGGYGLASFLLGTASSGTIRQINPISTSGIYYALFMQDDWRVNSKLTLNLGLRWDLSLGNREKYNRLAYFDPNALNPLGGPAGLPNLRGTLGWIGGQNSINQQDTDWNNLGPRIGFAYSVTPKTVLRGGYAVFFLPRNVQGNGLGAVAAFRDTPMLASIDGVTPANTLSNPYPGGFLPPLNNRDPLTNVGATIQAPTRAFRSSYAQAWSFNIQRELPGSIILDAHYWGNKGTALITSWNVNQLPNQFLALTNGLNTQVANPFRNLIPSGPLSTPTISRRQSLLPYPQYVGDNGVQQVFVPASNSTYHAATIQGERRLSSDATFLVAYTFSKAIDDVRTPLDVYNRRLEKAVSAFDATHQFVLSGVYRLPFGRERKYANQLNRFANAIVGGLDLNGIGRVQTGQPIGLVRPAVSLGRSARLDNPTIARWFDTSAFENAAPFTFGNVGPFLPDVRTDGIRNIDAVLVKNFGVAVGERKIAIQFRSEFYNLLNRVQFGPPNNSVSNQAFGVVNSQANTPRSIQFGLKVKF